MLMWGCAVGWMRLMQQFLLLDWAVVMSRGARGRLSCCDTSSSLETRFPCWHLAILAGSFKAHLPQVRSKILFPHLSDLMKVLRSCGSFRFSGMSLTCAQRRRCWLACCVVMDNPLFLAGWDRDHVLDDGHKIRSKRASCPSLC